MCKQLQSICLPVLGWEIIYERCEEHQRVAAYRAACARSDINVLLLLQKNIDIYEPLFFQELVTALEKYDVVGYAGATRWKILDWTTDAFEYKAGGFMIPSTEKIGFFEVMLLGAGKLCLQDGIAVLDGGLLAMNRAALSLADCDANLLGAETLLEQMWSYAIQFAGGKLAVHRNLGVMVRQEISLDRRYCASVRTEIAEKHKFDLFQMKNPDMAFVSIPTSSIKQAIEILNVYFQE